MTYAAYLRIYQPVAAFHEPDRSRWAAYAASSARPRRRDSLAAEQAEALRRAIAAAAIMLPDRESEHAYVRRADGVTYVCPLQTRLRCLLSYSRVLSTAGSALPGVLPAGGDTETMAALTRLAGELLPDTGRPGAETRLHILASVWTVPLAWFVPFAAAERWLALGPGAQRPSAPQTASATRALLYTTSMARARRREILDGLVDEYGPIEVPYSDGRRVVGWDYSGSSRRFGVFEPRSVPASPYDDLLSSAAHEHMIDGDF